MKQLIKSVKVALLKNMNGYNIAETVQSYEENVVHIQRCLKKLKSFGSLFDYSKSDSILKNRTRWAHAWYSKAQKNG